MTCLPSYRCFHDLLDPNVRFLFTAVASADANYLFDLEPRELLESPDSAILIEVSI